MRFTRDGLSEDPPLSIKLVQTSPNVAVVLARIVPDTEPDYCIVGRTRCMVCDAWCWLGTGTLKQVESGKAYPICIECSIEAGVRPENYIGEVQDRKHR